MFHKVGNEILTRMLTIMLLLYIYDSGFFPHQSINTEILDYAQRLFLRPIFAYHISCGSDLQFKMYPN